MANYTTTSFRSTATVYLPVGELTRAEDGGLIFQGDGDTYGDTNHYEEIRVSGFKAHCDKDDSELAQLLHEDAPLLNRSGKTHSVSSSSFEIPVVCRMGWRGREHPRLHTVCLDGDGVADDLCEYLTAREGGGLAAEHTVAVLNLVDHHERDRRLEVADEKLLRQICALDVAETERELAR